MLRWSCRVLVWLVLADVAMAQNLAPCTECQGHVPLAAGAGYSSAFDAAMQVPYQPRKGKITLDGFLFSRNGTDDHQPLLIDAPYPLGEPTLHTDDLDFEGELGGRFDVALSNIHFNYIWTDTASTHINRVNEPASDMLFFNIHDADDSAFFTARYQSRFALGHLGLRTDVNPFLGFFGGIAIGEISESLDMITEFDPLNGFYSQGTNDLYGLRIGTEAQIWSNGYSKIECSLTGGVYYNDIEINAQSQNWQATWTGDDVAFSGTAHIALVIPASPVNFRIGYQATALSGVAILPDASNSLRLWDGGGDIVTNDVFFHGLLFGVELLW